MRRTDRQNHNKSRQNTPHESNIFIIINIYIYLLKWTWFLVVCRPCALFSLSFISMTGQVPVKIQFVQPKMITCSLLVRSTRSIFSSILFLFFFFHFFCLCSFCFAYSLFALYFNSYFIFIVIWCLLEMINELVILTCDKRSSFQNACNAHSMLCLR